MKKVCSLNYVSFSENKKTVTLIRKISEKTDYIRQSLIMPVPQFSFAFLAIWHHFSLCWRDAVGCLVSAATPCSHGFWLLLSVWLRGVLTLFLMPLKDVSLGSDCCELSFLNLPAQLKWSSGGAARSSWSLKFTFTGRIQLAWCGSRERGGAFYLSAVCWHIIEVPLALWQLRSQSLLFCWDTANSTRWVSPPLWLDTILVVLFFFFFNHTVFQSVCLNARVSLYT